MSKTKSIWGTPAEQAEALITALSSDPNEHGSYIFAMKTLFRTVNRAARRIAKERAEYMDDKTDENYAAYHEGAAAMYGQAARVAAVRELAKRFLVEYELGNYTL